MNPTKAISSAIEKVLPDVNKLSGAIVNIENEIKEIKQQNEDIKKAIAELVR